MSRETQKQCMLSLLINAKITDPIKCLHKLEKQGIDTVEKLQYLDDDTYVINIPPCDRKLLSLITESVQNVIRGSTGLSYAIQFSNLDEILLIILLEVTVDGVLSCYEAIRTLIIEDPVCRTKFVLLGAYNVVMSSMLQFGWENTDIIRYGCRTLNALSMEMNRAHMNNNDHYLPNIKLVTEIMQSVGRDTEASIARECIATVNMMAHEKLLESGDIVPLCKAIVHMIKQFGCIDADVAELGLGMITTRARIASPVWKREFGSEGICQVIVDVMKHYDQNQEILINGCKSIIAFAYETPENVKLFVNAGICKILVERMDTENVEVAVGVGCAISSLLKASDHDDIVNSFNSHGVCPAIANMVKHHGMDIRIAKVGVELICRLAFNNPKIADQFVKDGMCEWTVNVLQAFGLKDPDVACYGISAIVNLSQKIPASRRIFGQLGACKVILDILKCEFESRGEQIVLVCCKAIVNLARLHANETKFGDLGGCAALVHVLKTLALKNKNVAENACLAVRSIGYIHEHQLQFKQLDADGAISKVIDAHGLCGGVLWKGMWAWLRINFYIN